VARRLKNPTARHLEIFRPLSPRDGVGWRRVQQDDLREESASLLRSSPIVDFLREYPGETAALESELKKRLRFVRDLTADKVQSNLEEKLLTDFHNEDSESQVKKWRGNYRYRKFLKGKYGEAEIALSVYDEEARRLRSGAEDRDAFESFKHRLIRDWESARRVNRQTFELDDEQRARILRDVGVLIGRFRSLAEVLGPIRRYFASAWDLSASTQHESLFNLLQRSDYILQQRRQIQAIADRLGRLDQAELEQARRSVRKFSKPQSMILNRAAKSTVIGIRESDDISAITSCEAVLLASPETEDLFFLKFAEKKLLTYDYQPELRLEGTSSVGNSEARIKVQRRGPIILAVDTSASMTGEWECDAKALALSIVRVAFRQRRSVQVISFSSAADSMVLTPSRKGSLDKLIRFLLLSFHGGTDLSVALREGLTMLDSPQFRKADMVFVTDGDADVLPREQVIKMKKARGMGTRFYSLLVGNGGNPRLLKQFDFNWRYHASQLSEVAINLDRFEWDKSLVDKQPTVLTSTL
jgi:uncharacterized protein with von Willebrand factor type A (vWA) domain